MPTEIPESLISKTSYKIENQSHQDEHEMQYIVGLQLEGNAMR